MDNQMIPVPVDFVSDGCTAPFYIRWAFKRYAVACRRHDWCRRHLVHYGVLTVQQADAMLYREWVDMGMWRWFARISWNVVKQTRNKYTITQPIPADRPSWWWYVDQARDTDFSGTG